MQTIIQSPQNVSAASKRIESMIHRTPIIASEQLNHMLGGHKIFFKVDSLQKTGAFKIRGILNHLLHLKEQGKMPSKLVAYSTGNHGIGLGYAAQRLGISARIYLPSTTARIKQLAAEYYGAAEVIYTDTRAEAEQFALRDAQNGYYFLHPSASDTTIAGAGTMCLEALEDIKKPVDAIFGAVGGGGLISGSYLAKEALAPQAQIFGVEPLLGDDAAQSYNAGKIIGLPNAPDTVADGLRTLQLKELNFQYIQKLDNIFTIKEEPIYYWTAWLLHLLKIACEPSCAMNMEAVRLWLKEQKTAKNILVLISGGNIDPSLYKKLWENEYLLSPPSIDYEYS